MKITILDDDGMLDKTDTDICLLLHSCMLQYTSGNSDVDIFRT